MRWRQFNSLVRLAGYELRRTRLGWLVFAVILIAFGVASFAASLAVTESSDYRIALYAAGVRLLGVFALSLLVVTNVVRDDDDQILGLMLSRPVSRMAWLSAKSVAYLIAAWFVTIALVLPLLVMGAAPTRTLGWAVSLACELSIVTVAALVAAASLRQVTLAFGAVIGFYLLGRVIQSLVLLSHDSIIDLSTATNRFITQGVTVLGHIIPDFAQFAPSKWLLYAGPGSEEMQFVLLQTALYLPLLMVIGLIDFQRRNI